MPDISAEWYRAVVGFAADAPSWVQTFAAFFTEAALVLIFGFLLLACWRARRTSARSLGVALLCVVGVGVAYVLSELFKLVVEEERPCRVMQVSTIVACPPPGDWSFPSNHSVIAGAAALGVLVAWRSLGIPALLLGMGTAFSRVFVGAHYPHDALVGFLFGLLVPTLLVLLLARTATHLVAQLPMFRSAPAVVTVDDQPTEQIPRI
ncbi:phosphatase PAP2 family protein [Saccharopolyspora sp. NPDC000359]|uniref:phosphatase PAP2 family protein n=1 Tax=Saccharopolyspora sp. NPDC000359 TaxID=3154251 RepID=UPI003333E200